MKRKKSARSTTHPADRTWLMAELTECERDFRSGDKRALAHAIAVCAKLGIAMPAWAAKEYLDGYHSVVLYAPGDSSWDSVLGTLKAKGAHLNALRKRFWKAGAIWLEIDIHRNAGESVNDALFAKVGKAYGLGTTLVKEFYGQVEGQRKRWRRLLIRDKKEMGRYVAELRAGLDKALEESNLEESRQLGVRIMNIQLEPDDD